MFKKKSKSLSLRIGEEEYEFASPKELDFALTGRTCLPASRIDALIDVTSDVLMKEAEGIKQVEQRFAAAVEQSLGDETVIGQFFKDLDLSVISQDNDWRNIINALYGLDSSADEYRRLGLVKYMQYLSARHNVVQTLYSRRKQKLTTTAAAPTAEVPKPQQAEVPKPQQFKETVLFDLTTFSPTAKRGNDFGRLPKGETVDILLEPNQAVMVLLAKHKFSIVSGDTVRFIDDSGKNVILREGKNIVGRDLTSDVVVDAGYRDVSRKHLIVETEGSEMIRLTDISSLGTSVPNQYLDATAP